MIINFSLFLSQKILPPSFQLEPIKQKIDFQRLLAGCTAPE